LGRFGKEMGAEMGAEVGGGSEEGGPEGALCEARAARGGGLSSPLELLVPSRLGRRVATDLSLRAADLTLRTADRSLRAIEVARARGACASRAARVALVRGGGA
jgi:hypothetical protein